VRNYRKLEREFALCVLKAVHREIGEALHGARQNAVGVVGVVFVTACDERQKG
jgi:hypothetical protein